MRVPSRMLHSLLKETLLDFKKKFSEPISYPVLSGCDDYSDRLSKTNLTGDKFKMTTLVSADFGDAFTETSIPKLTESISKIGHLLGYKNDHIEIMMDLVELVFSNSYFFTPYGLCRQTKGMPMGDFSSRESLDVVLALSEFEILKTSIELETDIKLYARLVDDISVILQNKFALTKDDKAISYDAFKYPN